jgi:hypothetical protein
MTPTEVPTPGRPLLRGGQLLVYPKGYVCSKCEWPARTRIPELWAVTVVVGCCSSPQVVTLDTRTTIRVTHVAMYVNISPSDPLSSSFGYAGLCTCSATMGATPSAM